MNKIVALILSVGVLCLAAPKASSLESAPNQVIGLGVHTQAGIGAYAYYAVSSTIHVGYGVGMQIHENSNIFYLAPYAKFLFASSGQLYPFIYARLNLLFGDASSTSLWIGGGMQAWVARNLALYASLALLDIGFDPSYTIFGLVRPEVGVEFNLD